MRALYSLFQVAIIIIACIATGAAFAGGLFMMLTVWTDLPVDNNALWVGVCVLVGATYNMLALFALVSEAGKHE